MKCLVIGSGGREHSIGIALRKHNDCTLYFAPGNAGTAALGTNVSLSDSDIDGLLRLAQDKTIDLTVVGPEAPLVAGIVDEFEKAGLAIVGPSKQAAQLEGVQRLGEGVYESVWDSYGCL